MRMEMQPLGMARLEGGERADERGRILKPSGHHLMDSAPVRVVLSRLRNIMGSGRRLVRAECYLAFAGGLAPLETFTSLCNDRTGTHPEVMMGRCLQGFPGTFSLAGSSMPSTAATLAIAGLGSSPAMVPSLTTGPSAGLTRESGLVTQGHRPFFIVGRTRLAETGWACREA